jgi:putative ABC transport system permease protein
MRRFLLKLFRRRRLHEDLEAELAFHREMSLANGNPIPLGNVSRITEESLELWRFSRLENLWRDLIYGARTVARSRALVVTALLSFGLGIGVNAVVFSLAVELLLSQPTVTDASSLVSVRLGGNSHAPMEALDFLQKSGVLQDVVGDNGEVFMNFDDGHDTRPVLAMVTTKNYFTALGIPIALGRGFRPDDPDDVVVMGDRFWRRHFNADLSVIGSQVSLEGRPFTVVGILPPVHRTLVGFGFAPEMYVPRYLDETMLAIYARLKPGTSLGEARARVKTVAARLDRIAPAAVKYADAMQVAPVAGFNRLQEEPALIPIGLFFLALLIVAALVLCVACVNVTGLLLARASARRRELAIRLSLGASRGRLLQQLLVESLLLACGGAMFGLFMAHVTATLLGRVQLPIPIPIRLMVEPDWRVVGYAIILTVSATLLAGLLPAWQAVRESIAPDLHRARKVRVRRVLVVGQVAVSLVVLAAAVLFLRNLFAARDMGPGFDLTRTLRAEVNLPSERYTTPERIRSYVDRALPELQALPGIACAAAARIIPFTDSTRFSTTITFPDTGEKADVGFSWNAVSPDFFRAMGIPVLKGRAFTTADRAADLVVVVNRTFVDRYLGGRAAVGRTFLWGRDGMELFRIVGVVEGTKTTTVGEDPVPQLYQPLAQIQNDRRRLQFVLRSATPPPLHVAAVRSALRRIEPSAGTQVEPLYSSIGLAFLPSQVGAVLFGAIGLLTLVLAAVGLYGMMAYSVARQTREIGIRLAIGATRSDISRMVLRDAVTLVAAGSVVGLGIAFFVMRPLAMFLVANLTPADPLSLSAVVVVLIATALVASWGPVRRAARVDPATTLRYD